MGGPCVHEHPSSGRGQTPEASGRVFQSSLPEPREALHPTRQRSPTATQEAKVRLNLACGFIDPPSSLLPSPRITAPRAARERLAADLIFGAVRRRCACCPRNKYALPCAVAPHVHTLTARRTICIFFTWAMHAAEGKVSVRIKPTHFARATVKTCRAVANEHALCFAGRGHVDAGSDAI